MEERPAGETPPPLTMPSPPAAAPEAETPPQPAAAEPIDYSKPVAYDQQGRPLYAHPPTATPPQPEFAAPAAPALDSQKPDVPPAQPNAAPAEDRLTPEARQRHEEALIRYPQLNLSDGEYVIASIQRDPIGMLQIWAVVIFFFLAIGGFVAALMYGQDISDSTRTAAAVGIAIIGMVALAGGFVFTNIYHGNKLYLTNESLIQEKQSSLFARHEQTVSLGNVQNVSYKQSGYLASLFDFGTIQITTEGDVEDYVFSHVDKPKKQAALINNTVETFTKGEHED